MKVPIPAERRPKSIGAFGEGDESAVRVAGAQASNDFMANSAEAATRMHLDELDRKPRRTQAGDARVMIDPDLVVQMHSRDLLAALQNA